MDKFLIKSDEYRPVFGDGSDSKWIKKGDISVYRYVKNITVDNNIRNKIRDAVPICEKLHIEDSVDKLTDRPNDNIGSIFYINNGKNIFVYTNEKFYTCIKLHMLLYYLKKDNIFTKYNIDIDKDISITHLEFVKYKSIDDLIMRRNHIKNKLGTDSGPKDHGDRMDPSFCNMRLNIYHDIAKENIDRKLLVPFTGYVIKIINKVDGKCFIGGYTRQYKLEEIMDILMNDVKNEKIIRACGKSDVNSVFKMVTDKHIFTSKFEFILRVDLERIKYDSVNNGYNTKCVWKYSKQFFNRDTDGNLLEKLKKIIFVIVQREIFTQNFDNDCDKINYIFTIKNKDNGKRYISSNNEYTFSKLLAKMYADAEDGIRNEITEIISSVPYYSLEFKIIKVYDMSVDVKKKTMDIVSKLAPKK